MAERPAGGFRDSRFPAVTADELAGLRFQVNVIHSMEDVSSPDELDPRRYGVIVSAVDGRRGILLPGIEGTDTGKPSCASPGKKD